MVSPDQTELPFLLLTTLSTKPGALGTWDSQSPENATHLAKGFCLSESQATTDLAAYGGAHVSTLQPARLALGPPPEHLWSGFTTHVHLWGTKKAWKVQSLA